MRDVGASALGVVVMIALAGAPAVTFAEEALPSGRLTMERVVALALERSLAIRAAEARGSLARGRLRGAEVLSPFNPELSGGGGVRFGAEGVTAEAEGGLAQAFELGGPRRRRIEVAEAQVEAASERVEAARLRVAAEARAAYVEAIAARQILRLAQEAEGLARRLHSAAEERGDAEAATDLEVNVAVIEWSAARRELAEARRRLAEADLELARVLSLPPRATIVLPEDLPPCPAVATPLEELVGRAVTVRRELAALADEVGAAEAGVALARAEGWPDLVVSATYSLEEGRDHIVGVGLSIPLPLFDRNQGEVARARAALELARVEREAAGLAVEREVAGAHAAYVAAAEAAEIWGEGVLGRVEQNLELLELALTEGSVGIVEVMRVQRELVAARRDGVESAAAVHSARARLELAVGEEVR